MTRPLSLLAALGVTALLALSAPAARAAEHEDLAAMIEHAKTAADHEKIAEHYDREAKAATEEAERHRKMEKAYAAGPIGRGSPTPLPQHCAALAKHYEAAAAEYATLAKAHRQMAKAAK